MSDRSLNTIKVKAQQVGLQGNFFRRYMYRQGGSERFMPDDGLLGWYVEEGGKETYLGADMDTALVKLDNWNAKRSHK